MNAYISAFVLSKRGGRYLFWLTVGIIQAFHHIRIQRFSPLRARSYSMHTKIKKHQKIQLYRTQPKWTQLMPLLLHQNYKIVLITLGQLNNSISIVLCFRGVIGRLLAPERMRWKLNLFYQYSKRGLFLGILIFLLNMAYLLYLKWYEILPLKSQV